MKKGISIWSFAPAPLASAFALAKDAGFATLANMVLMGKLLHQWLILTVEIDLLMFGRVLSPHCYIYAAGLTLLFSLVVNLSAHKKLKKLDIKKGRQYES